MYHKQSLNCSKFAREIFLVYTWTAAVSCSYAAERWKLVFQLRGTQAEYCVHLEDPPADRREEKKSTVLQKSCSGH